MTDLSAEVSQRIFIEKNPAFVEIQATNESTTLGGEFQEINDGDEIWLLQCPKGMDLSVIKGQKLKLPGRSHIGEIETVAVEFSEPLSESFGYCNRNGKYDLRLLPLSGSVLLRNRLKANEMVTADKIEALCPAPGRVPVPGDIKVRHPLLGNQFEDKLLVKSSIAKRLRQADEISTKIMQEIRIKGRLRKNVITKNNPEQKISIKSESVESENDTTKIRRRKQKHSDHDISKIDDLVDDSPRKKKKKTKHSLKEDDVSEDLSWLQNL